MLGQSIELKTAYDHCYGLHPATDANRSEVWVGSFSTDTAGLRLPLDVCFSPKATYLLRGNEMT